MIGTLIVTGAGRGVGAATARLAAAKGHAVCVHYRVSRERAEAVAAAIRGAGGRAVAVAADIVDPGEVARLFAEAETALGPIGALVNAAGIVGVSARVADLDPGALRRVLDVNVVGCFLAAGEAVRRLSTRHGGGGGAIVNVSSLAAADGGAGNRVHYAASKGAVEAFTVGLAREVAGEGIRVNAVRPGIAGAGDGAADGVAAAILWLLSDAASYVTGAVLPVGGES